MVLVAAIVYLLAWPVSIETTFRPQHRTGGRGSVMTNGLLEKTVPLGHEIGSGPGSIVFDEKGNLYMGLSDGRIIKIERNGLYRGQFANTGGRPLGMKFDATGALIASNGR